MHVIGVKWTAKDDGFFDHGLLVRLNTGEYSFFKLHSRQHVSWKLTGPRQCIGYRSEDGKLVPCPEDSIVLKGVPRCGPCRAMDAFDDCIACNGSSCRSSAERYKKCKETEYVVYLAFFGVDGIKVGVSTKRRILTRWVEQGADYGFELFKIKGGKIARQIEARITNIDGIRQAVYSKHKSKDIHIPVTKDTIMRNLVRVLENPFLINIAARFDTDIESSKGKLQDLSGYYGLQNLDSRPLVWPSSGAVASQVLLGEVVGMKGSLMISRIENSFTVSDLKRLIGYKIDDTAQVRMVTQSTLSDFTN